MMIEAGMDCYQAIQPVERIEEIKALYGDRLTLWGGVATSSLASGTPEEIRHEVLFSLKHCAPGGGFILGSSHSLTVGTKPENYRMMLDSNRRRGTYPISIPEEIPEPAWAMA
jgi:uroporphyrinogen-III decarboxylase